MLYSKNGSIPKPQTDGTEGWVEVEEAPVAPEGKEVVWWSPPGWVIRDPMPVKEGFAYSWSQTEEKWVEHEVITTPTVESIIDPVVDTTSNDAITLTSSSADSITLSTALDTITLDIPTAE